MISPYGGRAGPTFNLSSFGAVPDNATLNTDAFEKAVEAVRKAGGGTVVVPDGAFRTAPFNLTSHMTLFLSGGAQIFGPTPSQLGDGPVFKMWPLIPAMPSCEWRWPSLPRSPPPPSLSPTAIPCPLSPSQTARGAITWGRGAQRLSGA
jgi:hypothetical protein